MHVHALVHQRARMAMVLHACSLRHSLLEHTSSLRVRPLLSSLVSALRPTQGAQQPVPVPERMSLDARAGAMVQLQAAMDEASLLAARSLPLYSHRCAREPCRTQLWAGRHARACSCALPLTCV